LENLIKDYSTFLDKQYNWLKPFGKLRIKKWEDFLKSNPEGAICEAMTCEFLEKNRINVVPYENLSTGGPDFLCTRGNNQFYVEVTCVTKDKVTSQTKLNDKPQGPCYYHLLTDVFLNEISNKTSQCSSLNNSCLVAIGTLHHQGGAKCFGKRAVEDLLTGTTRLTMKYDAEKGQGVGSIYESTNLRDSAFIRFMKGATGGIEFARNPISSVLLCTFGFDPAKVVGAFHPNPNHKFDRTLLPNIDFCRIVQGSLETGCLKVEWI